MEKNIILTHERINRSISRLAHQIMEEINGREEAVIVGIYPNGTTLAKRLKTLVENRISTKIHLAKIQLNKNNPLQAPVHISPGGEILKNKTVILADDVMNSGKTTAFAISKLLEFSPSKIKTVVLVERNHKDFPIKADFVGYSLSTNLRDHVTVELGEQDTAYLL
jgi:pyrimidine operon attenuation protein/uracil phosphoribosyltransferase